MGMDKNDGLKELKKFFDSNLKIKELLSSSAIDRKGYSDEYYATEGADKLIESFESIEVYFNRMLKCFDLAFFGEKITEKFNNMKQDLLKNSYNYESLKKSYNSIFADMRPEFVKEVNGNIKGHFVWRRQRTSEIIDKSGSINELLHCMHSYVLNNEEIISCAPIIAQKTNDKGEPITIYGDKNSVSSGAKVAKDIFENFPQDLNCGITDIIAVDNKVLMMIRDKGHALSFDISVEDEKTMVNYFIPKVCNEGMVRKLKGISFVADHMQGGAKGGYEVATEKVSEDLYKFIDKVPTDLDMPEIKWSFKDAVEVGNEESFGFDDMRELAKGRNLKGIMRVFEPFKKVVSKIKNKGKDVNENDR